MGWEGPEEEVPKPDSGKEGVRREVKMHLAGWIDRAGPCRRVADGGMAMYARLAIEEDREIGFHVIFGL